MSSTQPEFPEVARRSRVDRAVESIERLTVDEVRQLAEFLTLHRAPLARLVENELARASSQPGSP